MLINLKFSAIFESTGKKIEGEHCFSTGLSSITGRNESGKSFRLEMIRYALWGVSALRASAKSFSHLDCELIFAVNDINYRVTRNLRSTELFKGDETIAHGVTPVNNAIIKIFGYDISVFDISNACLQGEVEAMTKKTPAQRKAMIDKTIGLDKIDEVIKEVNQEILSNKKTIEVLESTLSKVVDEPVKPVEIDLFTKPSLEELITKTEAEVREEQYLIGILKGAERVDPGLEPVFPTAPKETSSDIVTKLNELEEKYKEAERLKSQIDNYKRLASKVEGQNTLKISEFIVGDYAQKWVDYNNYLKTILGINKVDFTQDDINEYENLLEIQKYNSKNSQDVCCPECNHEFKITEGEVFVPKEFDSNKFEELTKKLGSNLSLAKLNLMKWENIKDLTPVAIPDLGLEYNKPEVLIYLDELEQFKKSNNFDLGKAVSVVTTMEQNYSLEKSKLNSILAEVRTIENKKAEWKKNSDEFQKYQEIKKEKEPRLLELKESSTSLATYKNILNVINQYETLRNSYEIQMRAVQESLSAKVKLEEENDTLTSVKKALQELKPRIKLYLIPSLNVVSSRLITQMSGGQRNDIKVTEDFDIIVDGQPVETLSGSGKAIANLSVRIALGTVLTNKVFSVFLADEIDASMDQSRSENTAECLKALKDTFKQIILVSHKDLDVDHKIIL